MPAERGVATVVRQEDNRVLVRDEDRRETTLPLVGFPRGFKLHPGQRVAVIREQSGLVARPLVVSRTGRATPQDVASGAVEVAGPSAVLQPASVRGEVSPGDRPVPDQFDVFVVDHGSADGPRQIIAIRPNRDTRPR